MKICLDTSAYSHLSKQKKQIWELIGQSDKIYLSTVALGELYSGFECGSRSKENAETLQKFLLLPGVETVVVDENIAIRYSYVFKWLKCSGKMIPTNDIWIASTALEMGARLVTYDSHFNHVPGLIILSP